MESTTQAAPTQERVKVFIPDTNVFIDNPNAIESFRDNEVAVPLIVLQELDKQKTSQRIGSLARLAIRKIRHYSESADGDLSTGVPTANGGKVFILPGVADIRSFLPAGSNESNDNLIIAAAVKFQRDHPEKEIIVISRDNTLRILAKFCGLKVESYKNANSFSPDEGLYSGFVKLTVDNPEILQELATNRRIAVDRLDRAVVIGDLSPNQCCQICLVDTDRYLLAIFKQAKSEFVLVPKPKASRRGEIAPKNDGQAFARSLLMDPDISVVSLVGKYGTGKTLISLAVAHELMESGRYKEVLILRPNIEVSESLGFLKGDLGDKFAPWSRPIFDNLALLSDSMEMDDMIERRGGSKRNEIRYVSKSGAIEIAPTAYIRGRSLHDTIVIVDEAQNLTPELVKMIVARLASGSKIVLVGDVGQIDNPKLDAYSNGLSHLVRNGRGEEVFGHILLTVNERCSSDLDRLLNKL